MKKLLILLLGLCFAVGGITLAACSPQGETSSSDSLETSSSSAESSVDSSSEEKEEVVGETIPY